MLIGSSLIRFLCDMDNECLTAGGACTDGILDIGDRGMGENGTGDEGGE